MRYFLKLLLFLLLFLLSPSPLFALSPGDLVINEIMKDPEAAPENKGEWFEIYNTTPGSIDLAGLEIKDDGTQSFIIPSNSPVLIEPGDYFVLGCHAIMAENGGAEVDYEYSYGQFQLSNSDDEIIIRQGINEIDRVAYNNGVNWPDQAGASLSLKDPSLDNNVGANWEEATKPYGDGDLGTPGEPNFTLPTATPTPTLTPTPTPTPTLAPKPTPPIPSPRWRKFFIKKFSRFLRSLLRFRRSRLQT